MRYLVFGLQGRVLGAYPANCATIGVKNTLLTIALGSLLGIEKELELSPGVSYDEKKLAIKNYAGEVYQSWGRFSAYGEIIMISEYMGDCALMYQVDFIGSIINEIDQEIIKNIIKTKEEG